jgi:transcriptional regulator with XRE-family HTH domain
MTARVEAGDTFGALLRRYRQAAALSQEELAERAGLSVDAVGTLERGRRTLPRPDTVTLLVKALGLSPEAWRPGRGGPSHTSRRRSGPAIT